VLDDRSLQERQLPATRPLERDSGTEAAAADAAPPEAAPDETSAPLPDDCADLDRDGVPDCQQSLAQNSTFQADTTAWLADENVTMTWSALDANGHADSGSLKIENAQAASVPGLTIGGASQCLAATNSTYYLFAQAAIASAEQIGGAAAVNLSFFASADCSGAMLDERASNTAGMTDAWQLLQLQADAPLGARSVSVRLLALKEFDAAPFDVMFDNVLVKTGPLD
jgi:hypothetical protein